MLQYIRWGCDCVEEIQRQDDSSSARPGSSPGQNRNPPELKPAAGRTRFCFWRPHLARAFGGGACVHEPPGLLSSSSSSTWCRLPSIHPSARPLGHRSISPSRKYISTATKQVRCPVLHDVISQKVPNRQHMSCFWSCLKSRIYQACTRVYSIETTHYITAH